MVTAGELIKASRQRGWSRSKLKSEATQATKDKTYKLPAMPNKFADMGRGMSIDTTKGDSKISLPTFSPDKKQTPISKVGDLMRQSKATSTASRFTGYSLYQKPIKTKSVFSKPREVDPKTLKVLGRDLKLYNARANKYASKGTFKAPSKKEATNIIKEREKLKARLQDAGFEPYKLLTDIERKKVAKPSSIGATSITGSATAFLNSRPKRKETINPWEQTFQSTKGGTMKIAEMKEEPKYKNYYSKSMYDKRKSEGILDEYYTKNEQRLFETISNPYQRVEALISSAKREETKGVSVSPNRFRIQELTDLGEELFLRKTQALKSDADKILESSLDTDGKKVKFKEAMKLNNKIANFQQQAFLGDNAKYGKEFNLTTANLTSAVAERDKLLEDLKKKGAVSVTEDKRLLFNTEADLNRYVMYQDRVKEYDTERQNIIDTARKEYGVTEGDVTQFNQIREDYTKKQKEYDKIYEDFEAYTRLGLETADDARKISMFAQQYDDLTKKSAKYGWGDREFYGTNFLRGAAATADIFSRMGYATIQKPLGVLQKDTREGRFITPELLLPGGRYSEALVRGIYDYKAPKEERRLDEEALEGAVDAATIVTSLGAPAKTAVKEGAKAGVKAGAKKGILKGIKTYSKNFLPNIKKGVVREFTSKGVVGRGIKAVGSGAKALATAPGTTLAKAGSEGAKMLGRGAIATGVAAKSYNIGTKVLPLTQEAIITGAYGLTPEEERAYLRTDILEGAERKAYGSEAAKVISESGGFLGGTRKFLYEELPGGALIPGIGRGDVWLNTVETELRKKGLEGEALDKALNAASVSRYTRVGSEVPAIVAANVASELLGQKVFGNAFKAVTGTKRLGLVRGAARGYFATALGGAVEAPLVAESIAYSRYQPELNLKEKLDYAKTGAKYAGTIGAIMSGAQSIKNPYLYKLIGQPIYKATQLGTYITDPAEYPGDVIAGKIERVFPSTTAGIFTPTRTRTQTFTSEFSDSPDLISGMTVRDLTLTGSQDVSGVSTITKAPRVVTPIRVEENVATQTGKVIETPTILDTIETPQIRTLASGVDVTSSEVSLAPQEVAPTEPDVVTITYVTDNTRTSSNVNNTINNLTDSMTNITENINNAVNTETTTNINTETSTYVGGGGLPPFTLPFGAGRGRGAGGLAAAILNFEGYDNLRDIAGEWWERQKIKYIYKVRVLKLNGTYKLEVLDIRTNEVLASRVLSSEKDLRKAKSLILKNFPGIRFENG